MKRGINSVMLSECLRRREMYTHTHTHRNGILVSTTRELYIYGA